MDERERAYVSSVLVTVFLKYESADKVLQYILYVGKSKMREKYYVMYQENENAIKGFTEKKSLLIYQQFFVWLISAIDYMALKYLCTVYEPARFMYIEVCSIFIIIELVSVLFVVKLFTYLARHMVFVFLEIRTLLRMKKRRN